MTEVIPKLQELFDRKAQPSFGKGNSNNDDDTQDNNDNNNTAAAAKTNIIFPLFSQRAHHDNVWKTVPSIRPQRRAAAILVPLVEYNDGQPSLLFTKRSSALPTHASEVSFPGGHFDSALDTSLEDTALREAQEELLGRYDWQNDVYIVGRTSTLPSINGTPVTPILAVLTRPIDDHTFPGHAGEVDEVFAVSLSKLLEVETSEHSPRFKTNIPVFPLPENSHKIWGLTAVVARPILHQLLKPAFGL
jgi:8-oxo-dGTP pyrophosphatase MutT (NUDIX family)